MKLVIGIVRPEKANDVLEALYRAEVRGVSLSRVQGHGGELDRVETYRGTRVQMGLSEKVRFEIAVSDPFVQPTIDALCEGAQTGEVGDGKIFVVPLERVVRIRTSETDDDAVTPVEQVIDSGDTAWMLAATALVLLMTPALGLFYAGLVRSRNTLNTFMMCVAALAVATVTWALVGYSLAFDGDGGLIGGLDYALLRDVDFEPREGTKIPHLLFMAFQASFCIVTTALVSGAVVERMRFGAFLVFAALWSVLVYAVLAHWAFGGGWLQDGRDARLRRRHPGRDGVRVLGAGRRDGRRRAQGLRPAGAAAPQRGLRAARRRAAVVRLVRLQRRQRVLDRRPERARLHEHAADAGLHARGLVRARPAARSPRDGDRRRDRDHRRLRRDHPGGGLHQPGVGDAARRARRAAELRRHRLASADAARRDARRARGARRRGPDRHPLHRVLRAGVMERRGGRRAVRRRRPAGHQALAVLVTPPTRSR